MRPIHDCLEIGENEVLTAVGSGGKTALLWQLAEVYRLEKVLITTTAKFHHLKDKQRVFDHCFDSASLPQTRARQGITLAGGKTTDEKLTRLSCGLLRKVLPHYQKVLIEGDRAHTLPLKAWEDHEPVVPDFTTCTVGVVPLWPVGGTVAENMVHRMPLFCRLTGACEGEPITLHHLAAVIAGRDGHRSLFSAAKGRKVAFLNQVESREELAQAVSLLTLLPERFLQELDLLVAGSVRLNAGEVLWKKSA